MTARREAKTQVSAGPRRAGWRAGWRAGPLGGGLCGRDGDPGHLGHRWPGGWDPGGPQRVPGRRAGAQYPERKWPLLPSRPGLEVRALDLRQGRLARAGMRGTGGGRCGQGPMPPGSAEGTPETQLSVALPRVTPGRAGEGTEPGGKGAGSWGEGRPHGAPRPSPDPPCRVCGGVSPGPRGATDMNVGCVGGRAAPLKPISEHQVGQTPRPRPLSAGNCPPGQEALPPTPRFRFRPGVDVAVPLCRACVRACWPWPGRRGPRGARPHGGVGVGDARRTPSTQPARRRPPHLIFQQF